MPSWYELENADEIPSPTLLIYPDRVRANLQRMVAWGGAKRLRPHVKTHKLPQIVEMKLQAGIDKFKTSTIAESEMTAAAGGRDVLLAYQPVGPNIGRLMELIRAFPETTFSTIVDDIGVAQGLAAEAEACEVTVDVLIDLNVGMNRTGILPGEGAAALYRFIDAAKGLCAAGLHAYDGHIHDTDEALVRRQITEAFQPVLDLRRSLRAEGLAVPKVVGCGTVSSRILVAEQGSEAGEAIEVSAGTSVLWDAGQPTFSPPMQIDQAAVLLARVISRPAPGTLCIDLGHKAVASEMQPPRVTFFGLEDATAVGHSEEHLVLHTDRADAFPVGTVLYGIPTHICPTVALHSEVWCVRQGRAVERWPVVARTRRITI
ncbi:D-TA family PLP-dependent enzyme [Stieleria mannarensis]|uniref:D-TA family PLP-dependent enzyme n=1 Tax=Stieleria mannarensis TaxID=2755585 RepID=UPI0015FED402|nr:D-TA family PLP-dependent enzyme [Rhodopirellula sp. JC639]